MKRKITERIKEKKGITLIALVITIIVLLILAGVTIATLTGDNGILTKAQEASIQTRGAQVEEVVNLWKSEIEMNKNSNSDATVKSEDELLEELLRDKQVYENEIDRDTRTIIIGDRVISYETNLELTDIYVALYNDGTLVFNSKNEFDTSKLVEGWTIENIKGKTYEYIYTEEEPWYDESKLPQWYKSAVVTKINFLDKIVPENIDFWFYGLIGLTTIENINNLDTSNVTNMANMFDSCERLTSIDLTGWDTSNVTDMSGMFLGCSSLTNIDLTGLDTSNVTSMNNMFYICSSLTSINLTGLDTSNVTDMQDMFMDCTLLTNVDLTGLNTSNVTRMSRMFTRCNSLQNLDLSNWDTSNVITMSMMFCNCTSLTNLNLGGWDTVKVGSMMQMFEGCTSLTELDLSSFDTSTVQNYSGMFSGVTANVYIGNKWNTKITESSTSYSKKFIKKSITSQE